VLFEDPRELAKVVLFGSNPPCLGGFDLNKNSGVGVVFGLLVRSLHVRIKDGACKQSWILR
jgi:hypothetical protein